MMCQFYLVIVLASRLHGGGTAKPSQLNSSPLSRRDRSSTTSTSHIDEQLLDVALVDLLTNSDFDEALGSDSIVLALKGPGRALYRGAFPPPDARPTFPISAELWENFQARNSTPTRVPDDLQAVLPAHFDWSGFVPRDKRILVRDVDHIYHNRDGLAGWSDFRSLYPRAKGYIIAWRPGYSKDTNTALLPFVTAPSYHGGIGGYILKKVRKKWKIAFRHIHEYI